MYEFQKDLLFDNAVEKAAEIASYRLHTKESLSDKAVEKHSATKEEQLAMLIDAAEQALPHEVLYPEPSAVTEVDERTGRAVRSIWRETAEIYGGIQASELADLRSNPLCRGIYLFEAQGLTTPSRIVIWNNTQGNGVPNYLNNPNDWSLAHAAAHIAAINGAGISSVQYAIRDLRNADLNIEKAFDDLLQDARAAIERAIAEGVRRPFAGCARRHRTGDRRCIREYRAAPRGARPRRYARVGRARREVRRKLAVPSPKAVWIMRRRTSEKNFP